MFKANPEGLAFFVAGGNKVVTFCMPSLVIFTLSNK